MTEKTIWVNSGNLHQTNIPKIGCWQSAYFSDLSLAQSSEKNVCPIGNRIKKKLVFSPNFGWQFWQNRLYSVYIETLSEGSVFVAQRNIFKGIENVNIIYIVYFGKFTAHLLTYERYGAKYGACT